jgi:hypothetical protein
LENKTVEDVFLAIYFNFFINVDWNAVLKNLDSKLDSNQFKQRNISKTIQNLTAGMQIAGCQIT